MLSRQEILDRKKPKTETVPIPGGGEVLIRVMSGTDRDSFEAGNYKTVGKEVKWDMANARARLAVRCLCDAEGNRLYTDAEAPQVGEVDAVFLDAVYTAARKLNRLTAAEEEEDRKLFSPSPNGDSGSELPLVSGAA